MVGVVLVTYNGINWVEECISSILNSQEQVKLVIVDNNSNDGTSTLLSKLDSEQVIVKKMNQNIGFGRANNIGIEILLLEDSVEFVYLINQDAILYPDTLQKLVLEFQNNDDYGILSPLHMSDSHHFEKSFERWLNKSDLNASQILNNQSTTTYTARFINAAHWMIPVSVIKEIGGFDPLFFVYGEDKNYVHRLHWLGYKLGVVSNCMAIHYDKNDLQKNRRLNALKQFYTTSLELLLNPNETFKRCLWRYAKQSIFVWSSLIWHPKYVFSVLADCFRNLAMLNQIVTHRKLYNSLGSHFLSA